MNDVANAGVPEGRAQLCAIFAGKTSAKRIVGLLDLPSVSAEEGFGVFEDAATLVDTVMGCAAHSGVQAGQRYTTLELKIAYHRSLTEGSEPVRAEGRVLSIGRRTAFAEAKPFDREGNLCASGTSTCIVLNA